MSDTKDEMLPPLPGGRSVPAATTDERTMLASWLDFQRATLVHKCEGLTDEQARTAAAPPSGLSLLALVRHMTEVERHWFRRVLPKREIPPLYGGEGKGFEGPEDVTLADALAALRAETALADAEAAPLPLDATGDFRGHAVSLRWIYLHVVQEYARHNGHADLLRERTDGATGF